MMATRKFNAWISRGTIGNSKLIVSGEAEVGMSNSSASLTPRSPQWIGDLMMLDLDELLDASGTFGSAVLTWTEARYETEKFQDTTWVAVFHDGRIVQMLSVATIE